MSSGLGYQVLGYIALTERKHDIERTKFHFITCQTEDSLYMLNSSLHMFMEYRKVENV